MRMKIVILLLIALLSQVHSEDQGDWVDTYKLPIGFLAHPYYAGYLNVTSTQAYYYNYFPSEGNPVKDPLIIRISAGPGCSGLYSAFYSKGPFIFVKGTKNFRVNPYNWNKNASVLFIQGPGEVGFSKGSNMPYNDDVVAQIYYMAIQKFYQKFPELKDQTMYLSGQQYAGIIVPRIAQIIVELNRDINTPAWLKIKLGGFLLNNPCTQGDECSTNKQFSKFTIEYLKNHYFVSEEVYNKYKQVCLNDADPQCQKVILSIESGFLNTGSDIKNVYNQCIQQKGQEGDLPCFDRTGIYWFLNNDDVKKQIHVDPSATWKMCNSNVQDKWVKDPKGSIDIYKKLLRQQHNLRIWIVSGAVSGAVPITGTKKWFEEFKRTMGLATTRMWEPWWYNHTVNAGDIEQIRGMTFLTVRSGGYLLWNDQPQIGYHILESFLQGVAL